MAYGYTLFQANTAQKMWMNVSWCPMLARMEGHATTLTGAITVSASMAGRVMTAVKTLMTVLVQRVTMALPAMTGLPHSSASALMDAQVCLGPYMQTINFYGFIQFDEHEFCFCRFTVPPWWCLHQQPMSKGIQLWHQPSQWQGYLYLSTRLHWIRLQLGHWWVLPW